MQLPPFLLDHWLAKYEFVDPPVRYNLASSTGPTFTVKQLEDLSGSSWNPSNTPLTYIAQNGTRPLREAVAAYCGADPDHVVITTGASEGLSILFCLHADAGKEAVLPSPNFPTFTALARAWGLSPRHYRLEREAKFQQSAEAVLAEVGPNCALALVNTPHNPTGGVMARDEIEHIAARLAGQNAPLIVDEVYHPVYFGRPQRSALDIENVILLGDMSKALSLPGLRMGWIIDRNEERRKRIIDARSYFTISGSPLLESLATFAMALAPQIAERTQTTAAGNLSLLNAFMEAHRDMMDWVRPVAGTIAFPWFKDGRNARPTCEAAAQKGMLVVPGDCFGAPDHIRLGFGAQTSGFSDALKVFSAILKE